MNRDATRPAVLVVEDHKDSAEILCELLELQGFDAQLVTSGRAALIKSCEQKWNAMLIDFELPDMTGAQLATYLRKDIVPTPLLVAVTGHNLNSENMSIYQTAFDQILNKPFHKEQLIRLLADARIDIEQQ